jgi:hypothetical protein
MITLRSDPASFRLERSRKRDEISHMNPVGKALWLIESHFARNTSLDDTAHARDYGGRSEISSHRGARLEAERTVAEPTTRTRWFLPCGGPHLGQVAGEAADRRPPPRIVSE